MIEGECPFHIMQNTIFTLICHLVEFAIISRTVFQVKSLPNWYSVASFLHKSIVYNKLFYDYCEIRVKSIHNLLLIYNFGTRYYYHSKRFQLIFTVNEMFPLSSIQPRQVKLKVCLHYDENAAFLR